MTPYYGTNPIRQIREAAGFSVATLAIESGMTADYLAAVEAGTKRRWRTRLYALAANLDVPIEVVACP